MKFYEIAPSFKQLKNLKESATAVSKHKKTSPDEATSSCDHKIIHAEKFSNELVLDAEELYTSIQDLPVFRAAYASFKQQYPKFSETLLADDIREEEYSHLQENGTICMDFHGLGLFSYMQRWMDARSSSFRLAYISACLYDHALYGAAAEGTIELDLHKQILAYLNVREDEYSIVFTASHASAFKLLGETFTFSSGPRLLSVYDHENESLNWMTQGAKTKGAKIMTASFRWPSMRICSTNLKKLLQDKKRKREKRRGLFVFPTQSEVTGTKYSYQWMTLAEKHKWQVVLDASALGPKDMASLGLSLYRPDFMVFPFYSIFGFDNTGFACLVIKKSSIQCLEKSSSGRSLGMVRIVPLAAESHTDIEDESEKSKAERFLHRSDGSLSEENKEDSPIEGSCRIEKAQAHMNVQEQWQKHPSFGARLKLARTEIESLSSDVAAEGLQVEEPSGVCAGHQVFPHEEANPKNILNSVHENFADSSVANTRINAIIEASQEEHSGGEVQLYAWDKQTDSIPFSVLIPSTSSLGNSSSQSMSNIYHNSSPHSLSNLDEDTHREEDSKNVSYKDSSTLAPWKRSPEVTRLGIEFDSMQKTNAQIYHQGSFSFRKEGWGLKSPPGLSPLLSETSLSNLAYESEPETSSGESDNAEFEENYPSYPVSNHTKSPKDEFEDNYLSNPVSNHTKSPKDYTNDEIQPEKVDEVEDSYHKRLGRDNGLIDSRKVDYFPSPLTEDGEDGLALNTNSGLFVYRKKGTSGYLEPLPDDLYSRDSTGSDASDDDAGVRPQLICRGLDHADSLGLTKVNTRLRCLVEWLVESFAKLHHARQESPHPLVQIVGPKVKFDRGAFVAFNLVDRTGTLLNPRFIQMLAKKSNIFLQLAHISNFYKERAFSDVRIKHLNQNASNPFATKAVVAPRLPVLTAALGFLSNFEDVYRLWVFVSRFLDQAFVVQEKLEYDSNQEEVS